MMWLEVTPSNLGGGKAVVNVEHVELIMPTHSTMSEWGDGPGARLRMTSGSMLEVVEAASDLIEWLRVACEPEAES